MECTERNLITRALTICHEKLTQSIAMEQKCFDLRSLSPALSNLWLLLVLFFFSLHHIDHTLTLHGPHIDPTFKLYFQHSLVNSETSTTRDKFLLLSLHRRHHHYISFVFPPPPPPHFCCFSPTPPAHFYCFP